MKSYILSNFKTNTPDPRFFRVVMYVIVGLCFIAIAPFVYFMHLDMVFLYHGPATTKSWQPLLWELWKSQLTFLFIFLMVVLSLLGYNYYLLKIIKQLRAEKCPS